MRAVLCKEFGPPEGLVIEEVPETVVEEQPLPVEETPLPAETTPVQMTAVPVPVEVPEPERTPGHEIESTQITHDRRTPSISTSVYASPVQAQRIVRLRTEERAHRAGSPTAGRAQGGG